MIMNICFFLLAIGVFHLFYQAKVFLNMLLVFELLTFLIFSVSMFLGGVTFSSTAFHVCLLVLCFGVTETVMGLAVLISCSRKSGKTKVTSFSFLKF
uniref:NADH-ubiquinone oxidoreductase chain 4L n=1 Tax=Callista chinensis TaxID=990943 RepID=A0A889QIC8_9BIVA|nr:NADH dehydrogenase subunit 4L [Callista chinensis]QRE83919.1 NADH dehydrogenase subunit 4L [Callista chinensis]QWM94238.1 NADH dehydrogenase subunit 4L [Callista chinensis]